MSEHVGLFKMHRAFFKANINSQIAYFLLILLMHGLIVLLIVEVDVFSCFLIIVRIDKLLSELFTIVSYYLLLLLD